MMTSMAGSRAQELRRAAAARLVQVLTAGDAPTTIVGCPHCAEEAVFADLRGVAEKVLTTVGDADLLRHVLPRLLEAGFSGAGGVHVATVTAKIRRAGWLQWPLDQQAAIADYLEAGWLDTLTDPDSPVDASSALAGIAEAVDDIRPFLEDWQLLLGSDGGNRASALHHLLRLVERHADDIAGGRVHRVLWSDRAGPVGQLSGWLLGSTMRIQLERAIFDPDTAMMSTRVRYALEVLEAGRDQ
jgi:hypothetical protein